MTVNHKLFPLLCLVGGLILGFGVGKFFSDKNADTKMAEMQDRLTDLKVTPPSTVPMKLMTGSVESIAGNELTVKLRSPKDPTDDTALDDRVVTVDGNTKVIVEYSKDRVVYAKEMAEWIRQVESAKSQDGATTSATPLGPPEMTAKKAGTIGSFKVGQMIVIRTTQDVKTKKSFVASSISILDFVTAFAPAQSATTQSPSTSQQPGQNGVANVPPPTTPSTKSSAP